MKLDLFADYVRIALFSLFAYCLVMLCWGLLRNAISVRVHFFLVCASVAACWNRFLLVYDF